ncbi:unnamed protein product [Timema podura]|uniref:Uncharacterized protein n=1 Tax=Timema podura TaxID=61482 RepID=A0ABN7NQL1_TIMPD|nr:unnamed protein product [Timema podura]
MKPLSFIRRLAQVLDVCVLVFQAELPRLLGQPLMRIGRLPLVMSQVVSFANVEEVEEFYIQQIETLQNTFGVLLLLYSVLCTKKLEPASVA